MQNSPGLPKLGVAIVPAAFALLLSTVAPSHAVAPLTAVSGSGGGSGGCGGTLSSLYTVDPGTGDVTLTAAIMDGSTQLRHITAIDYHPTTGILYAIANGQATDCSDDNTATLYTIDLANGIATRIGTQGSLLGTFPDMTFDPAGTLYAWNEDSPNSDDLWKIDITTGTGVQVGESSASTSATGLAADSKGNMWLKQFSATLVRFNQFTGDVIGDAISLQTSSSNMLAFDDDDVMYTAYRAPGFQLYTIDPETGDMTLIGTDPVTNISAIAFDKGTSTTKLADLSLTKSINPTEPEVGTQTVFTLTLSNDGPDSADNVTVLDVLPSSYTYVSQSGDGTYDETTGEWTLTSVANADSASIDITVEVVSDDDPTNEAEVVSSDSYDTDSLPGDGEGDDWDAATPTILTPHLFSIQRDDGYLWIADPILGDVAQEISLAGHTVCGGNGLVIQPTTDTLYAVLDVDDCNTRVLVTIDPVTADATLIGTLSTGRVAGIAFGADQNTLYAATGQGGSSPRTLFTVDPATGAMTAQCKLASTTFGTTIAYADGNVYDATYRCDATCQLIITEIDATTLPGDGSVACGGTMIETGLFVEPTGFMFESESSGQLRFLLASFNELYEIFIPGAADAIDWNFLGYLSHNSKGLASRTTQVSVAALTTSKSVAKFRDHGKKLLTYTVAADNAGPDSASNVVVTDPIPFGTTLVSTSGPCADVGGVITCDFGTLDSGVTLFGSFTVQVTCKKCSTIQNQVSLQTTDDVYDYPYDNTYSIQTSVKGKF